jgi:hypothetical protein
VADFVLSFVLSFVCLSFALHIVVGKVILWANMKPDWRFNDPTAVHSAMPVRKGRKLAGTLWIHASGFRIPELYAGRDCHPRYFYEEQYQQ